MLRPLHCQKYGIVGGRATTPPSICKPPRQFVCRGKFTKKNGGEDVTLCNDVALEGGPHEDLERVGLRIKLRASISFTNIKVALHGRREFILNTAINDALFPIRGTFRPSHKNLLIAAAIRIERALYFLGWELFYLLTSWGNESIASLAAVRAHRSSGTLFAWAGWSLPSIDIGFCKFLKSTGSTGLILKIVNSGLSLWGIMFS